MSPALTTIVPLCVCVSIMSNKGHGKDVLNEIVSDFL
jgi:hypothetical protein